MLIDFFSVLEKFAESFSANEKDVRSQIGTKLKHSKKLKEAQKYLDGNEENEE